jgi:uncharacterized peroxidase-related enzyme
MTDFPVHDRETAPDAADSMDAAEEAFGFVPNLIGVMAEAPVVAATYLKLGEMLEKTSFSPVEQELILLAASAENRCDYCVAAHTGGVASAGGDDATVEALRNGEPLPDARLQALRRFVQAVVRERGWVDDAEVERFREAGFDRGQVLELLVGVAMKTLSNYTNHMADTPLDEALTPLRWEAPAGAAPVGAD